MSPVLFYAFQGLFLGTNAGLTPGPLTTLVVGESLRHGRRAGCLMAIVPLITDPPILAILLPLLMLVASGRDSVIGGIAVVGGLLLVAMALKLAKVKASDFSGGNAPRISLWRAVSINATNPNLYIGWLTVNGTMLLASQRAGGTLAASAFMVCFYVSLVIVKTSIAVGLGSVRHTLPLSWLVAINRFLAAAMLLYAVWFLYIGATYLGIVR